MTSGGAVTKTFTVFFSSVVFDFQTWLRYEKQNIPERLRWNVVFRIISRFNVITYFPDSCRGQFRTDMSDKEAGNGKENPVKKDFRTPGLRGAQTTTLFRAVNPELFIKPVIHAEPNRTEPRSAAQWAKLQRLNRSNISLAFSS